MGTIRSKEQGTYKCSIRNSPGKLFVNATKSYATKRQNVHPPRPKVPATTTTIMPTPSHVCSLSPTNNKTKMPRQPNVKMKCPLKNGCKFHGPELRRLIIGENNNGNACLNVTPIMPAHQVTMGPWGSKSWLLCLLCSSCLGGKVNQVVGLG